MTFRQIMEIFPCLRGAGQVAVVELDEGYLYCLNPNPIETTGTLEVSVPQAGRPEEGGMFSLRKNIPASQIKGGFWTDLFGEKAAYEMNCGISAAV